MGGVADISDTQMVPGAQHYWPEIPRFDDFEASHGAALTHAPAIERIRRFIGPPA